MSNDEIARLQQAFEQNGCLKSYIELRRKHPEHKVEVSRFAHIELLVSVEDLLKEHGIDPLLVAGTLDADEKYIEELSLQLIERVNQTHELKKQGQTHIQSRNPGFSDSLINHLTVMMLEAVERSGIDLPPSLLVLVRQQLGGAQTQLHQKYETRRRRMDAIFIALQMQDTGLEPSLNQLAEAMQVEPSTVSRWFPNGSLLQEVDRKRRNLRTLGWPREE